MAEEDELLTAPDELKLSPRAEWWIKVAAWVLSVPRLVIMVVISPILLLIWLLLLIREAVLTLNGTRARERERDKWSYVLSLGTADATTRLEAARKLRGYPDLRAASSLMLGFSDDSPAVRTECARTLAFIYTQSAEVQAGVNNVIFGFLVRLRDDPDAAVRAAVAAAVQSIEQFNQAHPLPPNPPLA